MTIKLETPISTWWRKYRIVTTENGIYGLEVRYFMDPRGWNYINGSSEIQPLITIALLHAQSGRVVMKL